MNWSKMSSVAGVLLAAVASVASSHPGAEEEGPGWNLVDSVSGVTTLDPSAESTTVHIKTTSLAVPSTVSLHLNLAPVPSYPAGSQAPIVLFADIVQPNADRTLPEPTQMKPYPELYAAGPPPVDGFEKSATMDIPVGASERELVIRFRWTSPNPADRSDGTATGTSGSMGRDERPLVPRQPTTIRWRADVRASGDGAEPTNASVDIELAQ